MPDSTDARLAALERELARVGQQLSDEVQMSRQNSSIIRRIPEELATMRERVGLAIKRSNDCLQEQTALRKHLEDRERDQSRERKSDRRWLIGTGLSSAGLVIAALALLADKL